MPDVEQRLIGAADVVREMIPDGSAPPLRPLPAPDQLGHRRRATWLAPVMAAAAVLAIAIGSVTLASRIGHRARPGAAGTAALASVPRYFVQLASRPPDQGAVVALVRSTRTGRTLARIAPPRPYGTFSVVSGAADDRTFVLGARMWRPGRSSDWRNLIAPTRFFLLRINPSAATAADRARLIMLPISEPWRSGVSSVALAPDASRLAVACFIRHQGFLLQVFSLATGRHRTWRNAGTIAPQPMSWTSDDRYLEFGTWNSVWLLDTQSPGLDLRSSSHLMVALDVQVGGGDAPALITPDGTSLIVVMESGTHWHGGHGETDLAEFSVPARHLVTILHRQPDLASGYALLWSSPSGRTLILTRSLFVPLHSPDAGTVGIFRDGRFTPLPRAAQDGLESAAW